MIGSLYAGVSGLNASAAAMSVIGHNIANVNTIAFKANSVSFISMVSQSLTGSSGNSIGRGVQVGEISESWSQGTLGTTGNGADLAINGQGFFILKDAAGMTYYTRAGGFNFDADGNLVNSAGLAVQGYNVTTVNEDGTFTLGSIGDISTAGTISPPKVTEEISTSLNLDAAADDGDEYSTTMTVYDSLGNDIPLTITFTKNAGDWDIVVSIPEELFDPLTPPEIDVASISFDADGILVDGTPPDPDPTITLHLDNGATTPQEITWDIFNDVDGSSNGSITGYASESVTSFMSQDGYSAGTLQGISFDEQGVVTGIYTNGELTPLFQLALADFPNYQGLAAIGENLYSENRTSGQATLGVPGSGGTGLISPCSLEMSNVDLATEFVNMITSQRSFQASSRVITTSDEILQELINLKR